MIASELIHCGKESFDVLEDERDYDTSDIEHKAPAPDRNRKIVKEFARYALQQEKELAHLRKPLVFAINALQPRMPHSDMLVDMLRAEIGRGDSLVEAMP